MHEYHNIVDSKRWEITDRKKNSQNKRLLLKAPNVEIEYSVNNNVEQVGF